MSSSSLPKLVVIGSGWAGFYIAEYVNTAKYMVTILSPRRTSAFTPLLASAACGIFNFNLAEESVRAKGRKVSFVKCNVLDVDFSSRQIKCAPAFDNQELVAQEFDLDYDILIMAPGCTTNTFDTPGVMEHALFLKNVSDAMTLRKKLFDLLEEASLPHLSPERVKELLHVAVVGGGPTGVEITAELSDLFHNDLRALYPTVGDKLHISIFDVAPNILPSFDEKLHEYASEKLAHRGIAMETGSKIEKVDANALYLKDRGRIPYGMLIWSTGNKNIPLIDKLAVKTSEKGLKRILTDAQLRVLKPSTSSSTDDTFYNHVFALGDAADMEDQSLPTTAEVAVQKAKYLVKLLNEPQGLERKGLPPFPFKYTKGELVSYIGNHDGVIAGKDNDNDWTGAAAWLAWRRGSLSWTRSYRTKVTMTFTWVMNYIFGNDVGRI